MVSPETWPARLNARSAPLDRLDQRALQGDEAAGDGAIGGEPEQRVFRRLDLLRAVEFGIGAERVVYHRFADVDELAAQPGIVHGATVLAGIDDAHHGGKQLRQIRGAADFLQHAGMLELGLQSDGVGELTRFDSADDGLVDAAVDRVGEVL